MTHFYVILTRSFFIWKVYIRICDSSIMTCRPTRIVAPDRQTTEATPLHRTLAVTIADHYEVNMCNVVSNCSIYGWHTMPFCINMCHWVILTHFCRIWNWVWSEPTSCGERAPSSGRRDGRVAFRQAPYAPSNCESHSLLWGTACGVNRDWILAT